MGIKDLHRLAGVKAVLDDYFRKNTRLHYEMDSGHHETRIYINENARGWQRTEHEDTAKKLMKLGYTPFEPDFLIDMGESFGPSFAIIEFEEEPFAGSKPKYNVRGHNEFNKRDMKRDEHYAACKFHFLKLWQSQHPLHEKQIKEFLNSINVVEDFYKQGRILRI